MTKIRRLKHEALEACWFRGHSMRRFCHLDHYRHTWAAHCRVCDMQVVVCAYPQPNEIEIFGDAVALDCKE